MRIICVLNYNRAFIVEFIYKHWGYNTKEKIRIIRRIIPCSYITIFLDASSLCEEKRNITVNNYINIVSFDVNSCEFI